MMKYFNKHIHIWLPVLLSAGCALYMFSLVRTLGGGALAAAAYSLSLAAAAIFFFLLESKLLAGLFKLDFIDSARRLALAWTPLIALPLSSPYVTGWVSSSYLAHGPTTKKLLFLTLWLVLLAAAGSVFLKFILYRGGGRVMVFLDGNSKKLLWGLVVVYFLVFAFLSVLAYRHFQYHSDLGLYNQVLWSTLRGDFFHTTLEEKIIGTYFHAAPFLVFLLPLYALFQSPESYLVMRSLALSLAAIPMFYCVRRLTGSGAAGYLLAAAFLFHPEIVSQNFTPGYEVVFAAAPFLAAFYFYLENRFGLFAVFLVLTMSVREEFVLLALVFGFVALAGRRRARWVVIPFALGVIWQAAIIYLFSTYIEHDMFASYYGHFGDSAGELVRTVFTHPVYAFKETLQYHADYLYNLLMPVGFIFPWLSIASLFALPSLAIILPMGFDFSAAGGGIAHYSVVIVGALWLGMAGFIKKVQKKLAAPAAGAVGAGISLLVLVLVMASAHLWSYHIPGDRPADADALEKAISLIPPDASVSSNDGRFLSHASSRWRAYEPLIWDEIQEPGRLPQGIEQLKGVDYVVLKPFGNPYYNDEGAFRFLLEPGSSYRLIFEEDGIRVYKREIEG